MQVILTGYWMRLGKGSFVEAMWLHHDRLKLKCKKRTKQQLWRQWALEDKRQ